MARIRTVKPDFWEDDKVGGLSPLARLAFIGTWNLADDEGILRWTPDYLNASLFMYDNLTSRRVSQLMDEVVAAGLVFPYKGGTAQQPLAYIINFRRHQRINRPQAGKYSPPSIQNRAVQEMYGDRDGWVCHLCHGEIPRDAPAPADLRLSLDHIVPRVRGGTDAPSNIAASHRTCNKARGDRELGSEFSPPPSVSYALSHSVNSSPPEGKGRERKGEDASAEPPRVDVERLCSRLVERMVANGCREPSVTAKWRDAARLLLDRDEIPLEVALQVLDWSQSDSFWQANIHSLPTFREKFDRLRQQADRPQAGVPAGVRPSEEWMFS